MANPEQIDNSKQVEIGLKLSVRSHLYLCVFQISTNAGEKFVVSTAAVTRWAVTNVSVPQDTGWPPITVLVKVCLTSFFTLT